MADYNVHPLDNISIANIFFTLPASEEMEPKEGTVKAAQENIQAGLE